MGRSYGFEVDASWRPVFHGLGLEPGVVFRRAGLPEDLLSRGTTRLETPAFFRLWAAVEEAVGRADFPLRLVEGITADVFTPPMFVTLCSPDLRTAWDRLATYKPLVCPAALDVTDVDGGVRLAIRWIEATSSPPTSLVAMELAWFVHVARIATRAHLTPTEVTSAVPLLPEDAFGDFFGVRVRPGEDFSLTVRAEDAARPFLTANAGLWSVFEADLRQRLADLDGSATVAERVRAVLLDGLPSGRATMDDAARRLAFSRRTLQRRLRAEGTSFSDVLQATREELAWHYLRTTELTASEIGFLLGFEETSSFFRAFQAWTGQTPEGARRAAAG